MKLKNVKIGMKVQVKEDDGLSDTWSSSKGRIGEVIRIDTSDNLLTVLVCYESGGTEWGGHKGLRKVKGDK